jgi:hypothetical protein
VPVAVAVAVAVAVPVPVAVAVDSGRAPELAHGRRRRFCGRRGLRWERRGWLEVSGKTPRRVIAHRPECAT